MSAPVVRSPRDVVDLRVWFREQWREGGTFDRVAVAGLMQRSGSTDRERRSWSRWEHQTFGNATLWWVGEDMVDLLLASARGVPDDVTLDDVPKPSNAGLVVFAKPWFGHDAVDADNTVQVDAFVWGGTLLSPGVRPETPTDGLRAVSMSHYRRLDFDEGLGQNDLALAVETGAIEHARPDFNRDSGYGTPGQTTSHMVHGQTWVPLGRTDWPLGDRLDHQPYPMPNEMFESYTEDRRILVALWMLLHQEGIAQTTTVPADRPARRRAQRAGVDAPSDVRVVTLRRMHRTESAPSDEQGKVEWSHRWLVSGHWRWQRVGPGRQERRLTYVRPHVKGPDDKELVVPEQVNAWVR